MTTTNYLYAIALKCIVIHLMIILLGSHVVDGRKYNRPRLVEDDGSVRSNRSGKRCTPIILSFFSLRIFSSRLRTMRMLRGENYRKRINECSLIWWIQEAMCICCVVVGTWHCNESAIRPMWTVRHETEKPTRVSFSVPLSWSVIFISVATKQKQKN